MNSVFEWLVKLFFIVLLAPFFLSLGLSLGGAALLAFLPWLIALCVLIGLTAGIAAGLVLRRRLPPPPNNQFPPGEVPRIRRPRGIRTER
jgi:hypothetical protein